MLDIKFIRSNPDEIRDGLRKRRSKLDLEQFLAIDQKRRDLLLETEELKARRNQASVEMARMKKTGENAEPLLAELGIVSARIKTLDEELKGHRPADHRLGSVHPQRPALLPCPRAWTNPTTGKCAPGA
jgi:seryl-tRNA synthetase